MRLLEHAQQKTDLATQLDLTNKRCGTALHAKIDARQPFLDFTLNRANPDGSCQQFRISGEPMFNTACRFLGYRGIGVEITAGH